jgi:hypothetical protein
MGDAENDRLCRFFSTNTAFASAVCSVMKPTQVDQVSEALVVVYCQDNHVMKLIQWLITDEVKGTGQASKKFDAPNSADGEVRVSFSSKALSLFRPKLISYSLFLSLSRFSSPAT